MEVCQRRLAGDTARETTSSEVKAPHIEAHGLLTSPAFNVIKAAKEFKTKTLLLTGFGKLTLHI